MAMALSRIITPTQTKYKEYLLKTDEGNVMF